MKSGRPRHFSKSNKNLTFVLLSRFDQWQTGWNVSTAVVQPPIGAGGQIHEGEFCFLQTSITSSALRSCCYDRSGSTGAAEGDINLYVSVRQHALNGFISRYIVSCRSFDRKSFDLRSPLSIDDCYRAIDNGADDLWILAPVAPLNL